METTNPNLQNEEILFENTYPDRIAALKELCFHMHFKQTWRIAFFIFYGIAIIFGIALLYIYLSKQIPLHPSLIVYFLLIAYYIFFVIYRYRRAIKLTMQRVKELDPNGSTQVFQITDDKIINTIFNSSNKEELPLNIFRSVIVTKNYIVLRTKGQLYVILKKDGFTKGNYQDLCAHLRAKGLKVKTK